MAELTEAVDLDASVAFDGREPEVLVLGELDELSRRWREGFNEIAQWPPIRR